MQAVAALLLLLLTGTVVPVNRDFRPTPDGIPVFVVSNGFHTDLVLPLWEPGTGTGTDWLTQLGPELQTRFATYQYVAFGWGSERFYLESYPGHFPRIGTILRSALPGATLMHVDFHRSAPRPGPRVAALQISPAQYQQLVTTIRGSFAPDSAGRPVLRNEAGYRSEDFFFRARGSYHALRTCNDWTNQALKRAGIRAALKAPLAASVLFQARRAGKQEAE
ncbi:TIGR02117 family protein [Hymenobacter sp. BT175]|nr:TIGR02117 family protein [Hymenobacter translucens]